MLAGALYLLLRLQRRGPPATAAWRQPWTGGSSGMGSGLGGYGSSSYGSSSYGSSSYPGAAPVPVPDPGLLLHDQVRAYACVSACVCWGGEG